MLLLQTWTQFPEHIFVKLQLPVISAPGDPIPSSSLLRPPHAYVHTGTQTHIHVHVNNKINLKIFTSWVKLKVKMEPWEAIYELYKYRTVFERRCVNRERIHDSFLSSLKLLLANSVRSAYTFITGQIGDS